MQQSPVFVFDVAVFREQFPAFGNATEFSNNSLQMYWDSACTIIKNTTYGLLACQGGSRAWYLLTAHLTALSSAIANGENPGIVTSASIDKVSVTTEPPPTKTMFQYWLGTTPYGQQLLALMSVAAAGGMYMPGGLGRSGMW